MIPNQDPESRSIPRSWRRRIRALLGMRSSSSSLQRLQFPIGESAPDLGIGSSSGGVEDARTIPTNPPKPSPTGTSRPDGSCVSNGMEIGFTSRQLFGPTEVLAPPSPPQPSQRTPSDGHEKSNPPALRDSREPIVNEENLTRPVRMTTRKLNIALNLQSQPAGTSMQLALNHSTSDSIQIRYDGGQGEETSFDIQDDIQSVTATARITNIEDSITEEGFKEFLESRGLKLCDGQSTILFAKFKVGIQKTTKRTTVTFLNNDVLKRALSLSRKERTLGKNTLNFDIEFDGFTVLSDNNQSRVDIVALHGMNGHAYNSWEYRDDSGYSFMWLRDCLPQHAPSARIIVYGYNANIHPGDLIRPYAENFLEKLKHFRQIDQNQICVQSSTPLVLVGHSFGGLIIKQALMIANTRPDGRYDSIIKHVYGVFFIGTPHASSEGVEEETFVANFITMFNINGQNNPIVMPYSPSSLLFDLTVNFRELVKSKRIKIATLYESKRTRSPLQSSSSKHFWIVDEKSATLGVEGELKTYLDHADHVDMCKFSNPDNNSLGTVIQFIEEFYNEILSGVEVEGCTQSTSN